MKIRKSAEDQDGMDELLAGICFAFVDFLRASTLFGRLAEDSCLQRSGERGGQRAVQKMA